MTLPLYDTAFLSFLFLPTIIAETGSTKEHCIAFSLSSSDDKGSKKRGGTDRCISSSGVLPSSNFGMEKLTSH